MAGSPGNQKSSPGDRPAQDGTRSWVSSIGWATAVIAGLLAVAVGANLLIGRVIHWEIVSGLGVLGLTFLSIGRRYRTI